jgi:hypothetical protein
MRYLPFVLTLICANANALSGNEYRNLPDAQRLAWAVGVTDGILTTQIMLTDREPEMTSCVAKLEPEQIKSQFESRLFGAPERWNFPAALTMYLVLEHQCRKKSR